MPEIDPTTKEFYEQDMKAAEIRNLCLLALDASKRLLESDGNDPDALAVLLNANSFLVAYGIYPEMHSVVDPESDVTRDQLKSDPVLAAEWVGGQIREFNQSLPVFPAPSPIPSLQEVRIDSSDTPFGELPTDDDTWWLTMDLVNPTGRNFLIQMTGYTAIAKFIDAEAGPTDTRELDRPVD